ncbi:hypothetical protein TNCV_2273641 [Trichonephila clavipes]|nr:hypothetical protein TNCV_2273641 [Trichonephila clavipes]
MLNNNEIVTSEQEESDPVDDETDEDEDNNSKESSKGPSNADAFSALETTMERYEQHSECNLLIYCFSRESETLQRKIEAVITCAMVPDRAVDAAAFDIIDAISATDASIPKTSNSHRKLCIPWWNSVCH